MRILVVGNGGREHAMAVALHRSGHAVLATRPNAGMAAICDDAGVDPGDVAATAARATSLGVDLVVVGPEAPLVAGLADRLGDLGIPVLGPSAAAARIEGSKRFAKELMDEAGIPTAAWATFTEAEPAVRWLRERGTPMVVKADGLAAGKGVIVADSVEDTESAIRRIFSDYGESIVLEERLVGPELSVIALCDGETVRAFPAARDHKRVFDGDRGPNTGGMGAFSPVPGAGVEAIEASVLVPAARALSRRGTPFRGFMYAGIMLTPAGPKVLEFNARMGDPEAQPLFSRLRSDAGAAMYAAATGRLAAVTLDFDERPAVCVVMASGGYPAAYRTGVPIEGLDDVAAMPGVTVYHAGTRLEGGQVVTAGGRVLGVTALGDTLEEAARRTYRAAALIRFDGAHYRRDIAASAV